MFESQSGAKRAESTENTFLLGFGIIIAILIISHFRLWLHNMPVDLRAFYSGGKVVLMHQDPYMVQPLFNIEQWVAGSEKLTFVDPVPLPAYDLAAFAALALLPVHLATFLFGIITLGAMISISYCLTKMTSLPFVVALATTFFGVSYTGLTLGQTLSIAIAGLCYGVFFLRGNKPTLAALATAFTLIQPQIGGPVVLCALLFVPKMRVMLIGIILFLFAVSLSFGIHFNQEYLAVLATQARSEIIFPMQYSLTWLVHYLGATDNIALFLGSLSTLLLTIIAIVILAKNRQAAIESGAVLLLPATFSVIGGTYVHHHQVAVAVIAALILYKPTLKISYAAIAVASFTVLFELTGQLDGHFPKLTTLGPIVFSIFTASLVIYYLDPKKTIAQRYQQASLCGIAYAGLFVFFVLICPPLGKLYHDMTYNFHVNHDPHMFASKEWMLYLQTMPPKVKTLPYYFMLKLPTWVALLIVAVSASRDLFETRSLAPQPSLETPGLMQAS